MSDHQLNYKQSGQVISTVAVSSLNVAVRPTSSTLEIVDERYADTDSNYSLVPAALATLDSVSTVTTAACGRSSNAPSLIELSSVTGIVAGRQYLLTNNLGQSEAVTVASIQVPAKTVRTHLEPQHKHAAGSTFEGLEISGAVPAGVCNDDDNFNARLAAIWTFTGVTPSRVRENIELVRPQPAWATIEDLRRLEPGIASKASDMSSALAMAHFDFALDLRGAGLNPYTYNPGPLGVGAVTYLAAYHALKNRDDDGARERADAHHKRYRELRLQLTAGRDKAGVSETDKVTGSAKPVDIRSYFIGL